jgi:hypothetical protein
VRRWSMADRNASNEVGYQKPPKHTQFVKGKSGNPKGRPKGSQNLATLLDKAGRERVKVTANGKIKSITKSEASAAQLTNKAASGDVKAIDRYFYWTSVLANTGSIALPPPVLSEADSAVMASIVERIRQSESVPPDSLADPAATTPSRDEEEEQ